LWYWCGRRTADAQLVRDASLPVSSPLCSMNGRVPTPSLSHQQVVRVSETKSCVHARGTIRSPVGAERVSAHPESLMFYPCSPSPDAAAPATSLPRDHAGLRHRHPSSPCSSMYQVIAMPRLDAVGGKRESRGDRHGERKGERWVHSGCDRGG
jgi:hypothetical protein